MMGHLCLAQGLVTQSSPTGTLVEAFKVIHPEVGSLPLVQVLEKPILRVKSEQSVEVADRVGARSNSSDPS